MKLAEVANRFGSWATTRVVLVFSRADVAFIVMLLSVDTEGKAGLLIAAVVLFAIINGILERRYHPEYFE